MVWRKRPIRRRLLAVAMATTTIAVVDANATSVEPALRRGHAPVAGESRLQELAHLDGSGTAAAHTGSRMTLPTIPLEQLDGSGTASATVSRKPAARVASAAATSIASANAEAAPPADRSCGERCLVFVTSATWDGALGGITGADQRCRAAAEAAGMRGAWKSWLSCEGCGSGGKDEQAAARLRDAEYRLLDGTVVVPSLAAVRECKGDCLHHAIDIDENGRRLSAEDAQRVWTGTFGTGSGKGRPNCRGWSSDEVADDGEVGELTRRTEDWTSRSALMPCSERSRLYCFQQ